MPLHSRHWSLRYGLPIGGLLLLIAAYFLLMYLTVDVSRTGEQYTAEERDQLYLAIHLGLLALGALTGFILGKWLNGLGVAFAVLFLAVLVTVMVGAQFASYTAACHGGQNDIVRHWTC